MSNLRTDFDSREEREVYIRRKAKEELKEELKAEIKKEVNFRKGE